MVRVNVPDHDAISRLTVVSREAKKKQAVCDERVSLIFITVKFLML